MGTVTLQFTFLPFSIAIGPRVFTKIVREVTTRLSLQEVNVLAYLDNWLVSATSEEEATAAVKATIWTAQGMGFNFNLKKSHPRPTKSLEWLGMEWDTN